MSDTPRTDEIAIQMQPPVDAETAFHFMDCHARQLERELAEARKEISDLQGDVEAWKRETMIVTARLRGEKHPDDNGAISTKEIIPKLQRELAEVTKQRDALVNAIRKHKETLVFMPDYCDGVLYKALEELEQGGVA